MEPLAYTEIAVTYEESVGSLEIAPLALPSVKLRTLWSWCAIAALILFGGFGAVVSTAFIPSDAPTQQQSTPF
ncbi:hypothetical protein [Lusitaniella coriacea]|uniref:hypothetical protein n=1 Tax=Lusitaniella coriacea TaxID=1983105 RepID=UPI003CF62317